MSRCKRKVVMVPAAKADPPADKSSWPHAIGTLAIAAIIGIGIFKVLGWLDVYMRPPPGWTCWRVDRITVDGHRTGGHCGPSPGWHLETWEGVGQVAVPNGLEYRRHFVSDTR
jgi:hypothetical protein